MAELNRYARFLNAGTPLSKLSDTLAVTAAALASITSSLGLGSLGVAPAQMALGAFIPLRGWSLGIVQNAPEGGSNKQVTHPERGTVTFTTPLETMAGPDRNHLAQLRKFAAAGPA